MALPRSQLQSSESLTSVTQPVLEDVQRKDLGSVMPVSTFAMPILWNASVNVLLGILRGITTVTTPPTVQHNVSDSSLHPHPVQPIQLLPLVG